MRVALMLALLMASGLSNAAPDPFAPAPLSSFPASWKVGSIWRFEVPKTVIKSGYLTYRVTSHRAETCPPGPYYRLEPVGETLPSRASIPVEAAYRLLGKEVVVSLTSNVCDSDHFLEGTVKDGRFEGRYSTGSMLGEFKGPRVVGHRVR